MAELGRLSAREITQWRAFETLYGPLGGERVDYLAAMVAKTVVNMLRTKGTKEAKIEDFKPKWDRREMVITDGEHP